MNNKQLLIGVLVAFLTFGFFEAVFAASVSPHSSEAGVYQFNFNATPTMADKAAMSHQYDRDALVNVVTEQGHWMYRFDVPATEADMAATNHDCDEKALSKVDTEGGINSQGVLCSNC